MIANVKLIAEILQKYTAYKIGKETGISYSTVNDWKKGITSIYSMKLEYAIKLTELALKENIAEEVIEALESDEVEFATIDNKEQFK